MTAERWTEYRAHLPGCAPQVAASQRGRTPIADVRRRCDELLAQHVDVTRIEAWCDGRRLHCAQRRAA